MDPRHPRALFWGLICLLTGLLLLVAGQGFSASLTPEEFQLEKEVWTRPPGDHADLEKRVSRIIQLKPGSAFGHYLMARLMVRKFSESPKEIGILRKASELGQQAIELEPEEDYGYIVIAEVLDVMGQTENGIRILKRSKIKGYGNSWRTEFIQARLESDILSNEEVLDRFDTALKMPGTQPDVIVPYVIAILSSYRTGSNLVADLSDWEKRHPHYLFTITQAIALTNLRQYAKAHRIYQKANRLGPNRAEVVVNDAILLYRHLGRTAKAQRQLNRVLQNSQELDDKVLSVVHGHLGVIHLRGSRYSKAATHFIRAMAGAANQQDMVEFITREYRQRKKHRQLANLITRINIEFPGMGIMHALLGETLSEDLGDHQAALKAFGDAIILEPNRSDFYNGMGLTYYRTNDMQMALTLFTRASIVDPDDATAKYNEACALARLGRNIEALTSLREAIDLDPRLQENALADKDFASIKHLAQFEEVTSQFPVAGGQQVDGDPVFPAH